MQQQPNSIGLRIAPEDFVGAFSGFHSGVNKTLIPSYTQSALRFANTGDERLGEEVSKGTALAFAALHTWPRDDLASLQLFSFARLLRALEQAGKRHPELATYATGHVGIFPRKLTTLAMEGRIPQGDYHRALHEARRVW